MAKKSPIKTWISRIKLVLAQAPRVAKAIRYGWKALILIMIMDTGYLIGIWPAWEEYSEGPIQRTAFIRTYIFEQYRHRDWPSLRYSPVPISRISENMVKAVVVAEDSRFYQHSGFDTDALKAAMEYNLSEKRLVYGASTISQQTVKNIFLSPSRNPLRKWHEITLTFGMERHLSKRRILELYLNAAEFGRGIYGVQAAARHYWGINASELSPKQAAELAATLSAPVNHNPATRTQYFNKRLKKIMRYM